MDLKERYNVDIDGVKTYYFKNLSNFLKSSFLIDTPYSLPFKLRKEIKKYDIVHIHEHRHSLALVASYYARKNNIPYVLQAHGSVLPFFQKQGLKKVFDNLWGFKILQNSSKVLALTEIEKKQYLKMGIADRKIEIAPLGINIEDYSNLPPKGVFRKKNDINPNDKLLLFIGRIHKIKGLDLLLKSLTLLKNNNSIKKDSNVNIKLAIVGPDDGFLDEINTIVSHLNLENEVIMTGPLYNEDKKEALIDCDIFIMPSQYESFTTSGLEAMACGKPLILTKNNHIHNWVDGNIGFSSEYDEIALADSIKKLLINENLMKTFGENGKKLISEKYNWDAIEKQIYSIYKDTLH
ncbi:capsular glucan synthase [Methanobrevibacter cuticularis]|uniref:Capsular glucan synthase n=2 Tax=Methanobrevibacter cuticularis TaxID=47311 RepID=A0A166DPU3_9EURY|nr:capsular glucan synthase [Methanobrevibacter cuticularis]